MGIRWPCRFTLIILDSKHSNFCTISPEEWDTDAKRDHPLCIYHVFPIFHLECGGRAEHRHRFVLSAERSNGLILLWVGSASKKSAVAAPLCRRTPKKRPRIQRIDR